MRYSFLDELINGNIAKFYRRYVDDTLLLVKPEDMDMILKKFSSFKKTDLYLKETQAG